ncbi:DUF5666 domain-containing protein [Acidipila rosea]|nr:DUF5666 domain-containing protein [Acidipila rosea]
MCEPLYSRQLMANRFPLSALLVFLCLAIPVSAQDEDQLPNFTGYVTSIHSAEEIEVNLHPVRLTEATAYSLPDNGEGAQGARIEQRKSGPPFLRRGTEVTVYGRVDKKSHEFLASKVEIHATAPRHINGAAIEDRAPQLVVQNGHLSGTIYADGNAIRVTPATVLNLLPTGEELTTLDPHVQIRYTAELHANGQVIATKVNFMRLDLGEKEHHFQQSSDFHIQDPDYDHHQYGRVKFLLHSIRILPDLALQKRVAAVGNKLIPEWQKNLPDNDPAKISFHFIVLEANKTFPVTTLDQAGTILIPANVLARLNNEAQLACLLSADIAVVLERYIYSNLSTARSQEAINVAMMPFMLEGSALAMVATNGLYQHNYWVPLTESAYRVGLHYVIDAGYDPREAPVAMLRLSAKHPEKFQSDPLKQFPLLPNYLEGVLSRNYDAADFAGLKTREAEYQEVLAMLRTADSKAAKIIHQESGN